MAQMYSRNMYLTDEQYISILEKIRNTVNQPGFQIKTEDCTIMGSWHTLSNCGFCNLDYVTRKTALFPDDFPERRFFKFRQNYHGCPFDQRFINQDKADLGYDKGCFYSCALFATNRPSLEKIKAMADRAIEITRDLCLGERMPEEDAASKSL